MIEVGVMDTSLIGTVENLVYCSNYVTPVLYAEPLHVMMSNF